MRLCGSSCRHRAIAACGAALLAFAAAAAAQGSAEPIIRFLDAIAGKDGAAYSVPPGADLVIPFTVDKGGKLDIYLSPFRGTHGDTVSVEPTIDGLAAGKDRLALAAAGGSVFQLRLRAPALSYPGKYSGTLTVLLDGKRRQTDRLELIRPSLPRQAKLAVDWKTPTLHETTLSLARVLSLTQPGSFDLQVRNPSADWPAEGIFLRALDVSAPPGNNFQPERHLQLSWNGAPAEGLWRSPASGGARSIAPNQQVAISGRAAGLAPGEYTLKVALGAANAALDNENPVTLKIFVKHGVLLPLLVLLLAILISWVATKGLEAQRRRGAQLAKVHEVRKGAWASERDLMPAVAARALLKQAEDRNQRWFDALFGQDTTSAHLAKAELLAKLVARIGDLRHRIARSGWRTMVAHRANKRLTDVVAMIHPDTMDANSAARVGGALDALEKWFGAQEHDALYMAAFNSDIGRLLHQAQPQAFAPHDKLIDALRKDVEAGRAQGAQTAALEKMERAYGILKVLWERKSEGDEPALKQLLELLDRSPGVALEDFFRQADGIAWSRLAPAELSFVKPARKELEPRRAYELIEFEIEPQNPTDGKNFLFKHKATYVWTLQLLQGSDATTVTEQRTNEPRVVQYAPRPGQYCMTVRMEHDGRKADKAAAFGPFTIARSSEYGVASIFRFTEVAALGIATVFAVVTGLATYYFGKAAFGSITDYVTLFVWGAGIDQAKNFLQQLGKASGNG
jgi:hypothetical protein